MEPIKKYLSKSYSCLNEIEYNNNPAIIVVIPAFNESMILSSLNSLRAASCPANVMVIIVVNYSERASTNEKTFNHILFDLLKGWCKLYSTEQLLFQVVLVSEMPRKHAGAGLARKTGMDTAIDVFFNNKNPEGVILSLDADTKVKPNYFETVHAHFGQYPDTNILLIDFHHDIEAAPPELQRAIILYELYLNYYVLGIRLAGFPYAYHTIGSAFAVNAAAYVRQGGMNKKHAGEDFYFLHKMFPLQENYRTYNTYVYPSARVSLRVPFGTGPAMHEILKSDLELSVYHPDAFMELKDFYLKMGDLFQKTVAIDKLVGEGLSLYLSKIDFNTKIKEARNNTSSRIRFIKRLLRHFDAFQLVKYLNFAHENGYYKRLPVVDAVQMLLFQNQPHVDTNYNLLMEVRKLEKTTPLRQLR